MASFSTASHLTRPTLYTHTGHLLCMNGVLCKLWKRTSELFVSVLAVVLHRHRPLGHVRTWRHPPVCRQLVDLSTMEERHVIITYRLDRATIQCTQLEPNLMSAIRHPTGIPPQVQVLSVLHFLASGSFQTTVAIMHPEGLAEVEGGLDSGIPGNPQTQDEQGPGVSGSGHTVQGTEAQDNREAGRTAVRQGEDRPREPTLHKALSNILGTYIHSQDTMGQILTTLQETQLLQEGHDLGIRDDFKNIYTILVTIAGVLADMGKIMREAVAQQWAPDTSHTDEQPSTSTGSSGQETLPQDQQATSTPPLAEGEPPCKRSLRSRQKPENIAKTPRQEIRLS
ncbi:hypothetical protein NDU88_001946 [Pleurodeles waltl]|uniref:Uncharacterized protein n=1 Tax=Pleurodeles waltl TaxID=8319 RepID=A0AAV7T0K7_PLEWA|nr:hypothetical protein NDU88_001946 [Pleurodeles waltl]